MTVERVTDPEEWREPPEGTNSVYRSAGPWRCRVCGGLSWKPYRCDATRGGSRCGADLANRGVEEAVRFDPSVTTDG